MAVLTEERKKILRAEMLRRWKQKLRRKGAAAAAGGDPKKTSGIDPKTGKKYGTGSMKGFAWTAGQGVEERDYIKTLRQQQKDTGKITTSKGRVVDKKKVSKKVRAIGAGSPKLVTAMSMKSKSKGGTVSYASHAAEGKKKEAAAWRRKHLAAAGDDVAKQKKIQKRYFHMRGKKLPKKHQ